MLFCDLPAYLIGIQCPLDILEEREKKRKNRTLGQARLQYDIIHAYCTYDLEVDTSRFTAQECAQQIIQRIQSTTPPEALKEMARWKI